MANLIPIPMRSETVDMTTGERTESTINAFLMPARPGTCEQCATAHDPAAPHNAQSLFYQMRFQAEHGRAPDWRDAFAHCDAQVQTIWTEALKGMGVDVEGGQVNPEKRR